tara:strand:+ start:42 stop:377 length:336 start_codon:yes stop_codon:yes gene_type:complete
MLNQNVTALYNEESGEFDIYIQDIRVKNYEFYRSVVKGKKRHDVWAQQALYEDEMYGNDFETRGDIVRELEIEEERALNNMSKNKARRIRNKGRERIGLWQMQDDLMQDLY